MANVMTMLVVFSSLSKHETILGGDAKQAPTIKIEKLQGNTGHEVFMQRSNSIEPSASQHRWNFSTKESSKHN